MKQALQIKMGQSLAMTPQLQQAIRLLQLSTLELQGEIQEALENNPLLEVSDDEHSQNQEQQRQMAEGNTAEAVAERVAETAVAENNTVVERAAEVAAENAAQSAAEAGADIETIPDELPVDTVWDDIYDMSGPATPMLGRGDDEGRDFTEYHSNGVDSLRDHLLEQIHLCSLGDIDRDIATRLIECLGDDGYLSESLESLLEGIQSEFEDPTKIDIDEVLAVLRLVQKLDPVGCGARDLGECITVQLEELAPCEVRDWALAVAREHMGDIAQRDVAKVRRQLGLSEAQLFEALALIRSMNPRPGGSISASTAQYIVPDVYVRRASGRDARGQWQVELNPDIAPRLGINNTYASMVRRADKSDDNTFIRNHLQEARWFIKSLQSRNETLLRVATAIVAHQRDYFEQGEVAMKPLVLRDIAEQLNMHESTISRVTTHKYMHTPNGILEFKYFFSSHVSTTDGGECSATAIRAMIRNLVAAESTKQPLSDSKIANLLISNGINVARRTIAKYREAMSIPPSNERKRIG